MQLVGPHVRHIIEHYEGELRRGAASYRFDDLPLRVAQKTLPANYDMDEIAGVLRIAGGGGTDTIEINARKTDGSSVDISWDPVVDPEFDGFRANVAKLAELTGEDTATWRGYLAAHRARRAFFASMGATSTDHGHPTARTCDLTPPDCQRLLDR